MPDEELCVEHGARKPCPQCAERNRALEQIAAGVIADAMSPDDVNGAALYSLYRTIFAVPIKIPAYEELPIELAQFWAVLEGAHMTACIARIIGANMTIGADLAAALGAKDTAADDAAAARAARAAGQHEGNGLILPPGAKP